jgi:PDZ domain-containing protein
MAHDDPEIPHAQVPQLPEPTAAPSPAPGRPRRARRWWAAFAASALLVAAVGAAFVRLPYYTIAPGSARDVDSRIRVAAPGPYFPPAGRVLFVTVSVGPTDNVYEAIGGWLDPAVDVVPEEAVIPKGTSLEEYNRQNVEAMVDSKETAQYVALTRLGYAVPEHGEGAVVRDVRTDLNPAVSVLHVGDVVTAVDGRRVELADDLVAAIAGHRPGERVRLVVAPAGRSEQRRQLEVPLAARPDGTAVLGVALETFHRRFDFPFRVEIDSAQVGGPSAGLAFTLALLDVLTPGELTGGVPVAATGTIDRDGRIGPVGGVAQKTIAVKRAGAKLFIVPSEEYAEAKSRAGRGLRVEKADTLDEALRILGSLRGSNALALGRPGASAP